MARLLNLLPWNGAGWSASSSGSCAYHVDRRIDDLSRPA